MRAQVGLVLPGADHQRLGGEGHEGADRAVAGLGRQVRIIG